MNARLLAVGLFLARCAYAQAALPEGEGREVTERLCLKCHGPENFVNRKYTKEGWDQVIYGMQSRGLTAPDDELETVARYAARFLGPPQPKVNVNRVTAKDLESALRLPADQAEAIIRYRTEKGDFHTWEDVAKVPGVDRRVIEENKSRLAF